MSRCVDTLFYIWLNLSLAFLNINLHDTLFFRKSLACLRALPPVLQENEIWSSCSSHSFLALLCSARSKEARKARLYTNTWWSGMLGIYCLRIIPWIFCTACCVGRWILSHLTPSALETKIFNECERWMQKSRTHYQVLVLMRKCLESNNSI